MSGRGLRDWQDLGLLPLQDHEDGVPHNLRLSVAGARVRRIPPVSDEPKESLVEIAQEESKGTIGDVHPWSFWQTGDRADRGMGAWAQVFAGLTGKDGTGGSRQVTPIRNHEYAGDERFSEKTPNWPECFSKLPKGYLVGVLPAMEESKQHDLMLSGDPRLFAPNVSGPGDVGTLVVDLQPTGEPCMAESTEPGIGGRHARLQSMLRVIAVPKTGIPLLGGRGNAIAWNLSTSQQDGLWGYGACFALIDGSVAGPPTGGDGPFTGPRTGPRTRGANTGAAGAGNKIGKNPCEYGEFDRKPRAQHGIGLMAQLGGCGPFHAGNASDKHRIGVDADGHPINSGHISVNAYFYEGQQRDGPFFFEGQYPDPGPLPMQARVHLTWDPKKQHKWLAGQRNGMWRWWCEVPWVDPEQPPDTPDDGGPPDPGPPTPGPPSPGPPTPGPGGPRTGPPTGDRGGDIPDTGGRGDRGGGIVFTDPRGPIGEPQQPPSTPENPPPPITGPRGAGPPSGPLAPPKRNGKVGGISTSDVGLWLLHHPLMESWTDMAWRPQMMFLGRNSYVHNPRTDPDELRRDEAIRPQVVALRPWGAQNAPEWNYAIRPIDSRARGGVAAGGVLFSPPEFELEDYLSIGEALDVDAPTAQGYVACAPGIGFALGKPNTDGGMDPGAVIIDQDETDDDYSFRVRQHDSSRAEKELVSGRVSQTNGEVVVDLARGGNEAVGLPRGTTAQRPTDLVPTGGELRVNTDVEGGEDTLEYYDAQRVEWRQLSDYTAGGPITTTIDFTATSRFSYEHSLGQRPGVSVTDSTGREIEVCVEHESDGQVTLHFIGTITDGKLVLST